MNEFALSYRQRRLVHLFVFLAKVGAMGATLRDIELALNYAHRSAAVDDLLRTLLDMRIIRRERMWMQPRAPYRFFAHEDAQKCAGRLTYKGWLAKQDKGRD